MDISINIPTEKGTNIMEELMFTATPPHPPSPGRDEYHKDAHAPGLALNDYVMRTPSDDGTYVHIIEHREWVEKIKQPPTPEEIAAARLRKEREDKMMMRVLGGLGLAFITVVGAVTYLDSKNAKVVVEKAANAVK